MWYDEFAKLQPGWNSYGAKPITELSIKIARIMTEKAPSIVPTSIGGVQLEWHCDGADIELEISPEGDLIESSLSLLP